MQYNKTNIKYKNIKQCKLTQCVNNGKKYKQLKKIKTNLTLTPSM